MTPLANNIVRLKSFVDRDEELEIIRAKLEAIKPGKWLFNFIIRISGIPGIGKSNLLDKIKTTAEQQNIHTIFIKYEKDVEKLYIIKKISELLFSDTTDWQDALKTYNEDQTRKYSFNRLIDIFASNLSKKLENTPLVLLIDDSHYIDENSQDIMEDVLERIYNKNRMLLVIAGRADLRWKSFELRRRTQAIPLDCFQEKDTAQLLSEPNPVLSKKVYRLTHGYPLASVKAYQWIFDNIELTASDFNNQLENKEVDLIFDLVNCILADRILTHISDKEHREKIDGLLKKVCPLRRFDDILLDDFLPVIEPNKFIERNTMATRSYIRQMAIATYIVQWNSAKMAYSLDYSMRRLFALEMKFRNKPMLINIHKSMMDWYQKAIDDSSDKSAPHTVLYLIEHIFHFAHFSQLTNTIEQMGFEIQKKIARQFEGYYPREKNHFYEEFRNDAELIELLGDNSDQLKNVVESKLK